jgi:hypothetical protein
MAHGGGPADGVVLRSLARNGGGHLNRRQGMGSGYLDVRAVASVGVHGREGTEPTGGPLGARPVGRRAMRGAGTSWRPRDGAMLRGTDLGRYIQPRGTGRRPGRQCGLLARGSGAARRRGLPEFIWTGPVRVIETQFFATKVQ